MTMFNDGYKIDHFDRISQQPRSSVKLREQRWSTQMQELASWFKGRVEKRKSRRALSKLSDAQLKDIGLTKSQVLKEVRKGFFE